MQKIFVIGFPRSGTTFLAATLQKSLGYPATPETRFYEEFHPLIFQRSPQKLRAYLEKKVRLIDMEPDFSFLDNGVKDRKSIMNRLLEDFAHKSSETPPVGVIEKSPVHQMHCAAIKADFPDAKIVYITRHPLMSFNSLRSAWWGEHWKAKDTALQWLWRTNKSIRDIDAGLIDHAIRFEDLVTEPEDQIAKMLAKLDVPVATTGGAATGSSLVPEWEREWKSKALEAPDKTRAEINPTKLSEEDIKTFESIAKDTMAHFNYETLSAADGPSSPLDLKLYGARDRVRRVFYHSGVNRLMGRKDIGEEI